MLYWSLMFLVFALVAGLLGFTGLAGAAASIAKVLFFVFLVVFVISLLVGRKRPVNEDQFHRVVTKIRTMAGGSLEGVKVGVWGLTFKARTDDTRDSPAIRIIHLLLAEGADVSAYDPAVKGKTDRYVHLYRVK